MDTPQNSPQNILAIDTATNILSIALSAGNRRWYVEADAGLRHSEILMDLTDLLLKQGGLKPADLNLVACMKGPGSFTGLRIGFSAAKGLALSLGIPLRAIPTLDCMAWSLSPWPGLVVPVMDAKKHRFFTALYRGGEKIHPDMDADPAEIAGAITRAIGSGPGESPVPVILTGADAPLLRAELLKQGPGPFPILIDPAYRKGRGMELLELAIKDKKADTVDEASFAGPEYIRKSDAELKS
ncbi:hypothetical protein AGMMS49546_35280 [Spirochaetia bacterium]|nr:hypothetical protein AGMMS49546_35280 [Spirochaetia bacterium]